MCGPSISQRYLPSCWDRFVVALKSNTLFWLKSGLTGSPTLSSARGSSPFLTHLPPAQVQEVAVCNLASMQPNTSLITTGEVLEKRLIMVTSFQLMGWQCPSAAPNTALLLVHSHPPTGPATGGLSYLITTVCSVRFSCHKVHKAPRTNHLLSNDNSVKWSSLSEQPQMGCWGEQFISGKFTLMAVKVTNYQLLHHRKTPATARRLKSYFKQCYRFSGNHKLTTSHCLSVDFQ